MQVRSRFAPSPTGFLHIGGARTALYAWAFARRHGGTFILRIEDTDVERSTPEAVQAILDGMDWLNLQHDEGPFFQMQRMPRYKEVIGQMLSDGRAYHCYMSADELNALREAQRARSEKPRYDGTWRPEPGKVLSAVPDGVKPVVRFRNPVGGSVVWQDAVKGRIEISNDELDDLIIARGDGTPTYNFCVCVDDWDMKITHVIRGDDHVNNTPRQINILTALGAEIPVYAHLSMILGDDGHKLSKRHGAVSVMEYERNGYLPEAVLNYLARLGWSHGNDEVFSMDQFCQWFDLDHITPSAAQFNTEKLDWLNGEYIKRLDEGLIGEKLETYLERQGINVSRGPEPGRVAALLRDRSPTMTEMAIRSMYFYETPNFDIGLLASYLTEPVNSALDGLLIDFETAGWNKAEISRAIKVQLGNHGLKMPQLMMPIRLMLTGETQSPSVDAVLEVIGREKSLARLRDALIQVKALAR